MRFPSRVLRARWARALGTDRRIARRLRALRDDAETHGRAYHGYRRSDDRRYRGAR